MMLPMRIAANPVRSGLDSAIEESSFVYTDQFGPEAGLVVDNQYFNNGTNSSPKLYVFNYVYSGYVISPYDFMSAFTKFGNP